MALRPVRPREGALWGRRLAGVAWAIYRAAGVRAGSAPTDLADLLADQPFVGWEETASGIQAAEWLANMVPSERFAYRTNSLVNQLLAARHGIGLALLPCYLGDPDPGVQRALPQPVEAIAGELWIVTHADLKGTARVRAFFDVVGDGLAREAALFEGGQDCPASKP